MAREQILGWTKTKFLELRTDFHVDQEKLTHQLCEFIYSVSWRKQEF